MRRSSSPDLTMTMNSRLKKRATRSYMMRMTGATATLGAGRQCKCNVSCYCNYLVHQIM